MSSVSQRFTLQDPSDNIKSHFQSTPWAMKLFSDPTLQPFITESRIVKPTTTGDTFVARTLATEDTISAWQSFHAVSAPGTEHGETITLLKLGSGVNGHIDICRGGFVSLVLDEVIGTAADHVKPPDKLTMTAYLKVDYKKPVPTPSVVLCRAWIQRTEGRKMFGRGTVEDGEGTVMATGEGLFVVIPKVAGKVKL